MRYVPKAVNFSIEEMDETVSLDLETEKYTFITHDSASATEMTTKALYIKDKFSIPDRAYHKLSLLTSELPPQNQLKKLSKEINNKSNITLPPEGIIGVQQKFRDQLLIRLDHMSQDTDALPDTLKIKLSGDGTNVARSMHLINFTFTLLDEPQAVNHTLAILKATESYDELKTGLNDLVEEMEGL